MRALVGALLLVTCSFGAAARLPSLISITEQQQDRGPPAAAVVGSAVADDEGQLAFDRDPHAHGARAHAVFVDSSQTVSNFGKLRIVTHEAYSDLDQMYAAGWLEGYVTAARIWDHYLNMKHYFLHQLNASLAEPIDWLIEQEAWARKQVASHADSEYYQALGLVLAQYDGLQAGYAARAREEGSDSDLVGHLRREDLMFLNHNGDLYDILDMFTARHNRTQPVNKALETQQQQQEKSARQGRLWDSKWDDMDADKLFIELALQGKCSALVKVAPDLSEVYMGHSTWDSYTAMTRIYKHYDLALRAPFVRARRLSFSSYPGELHSDDDFYITDSSLVVMETTNHIYNQSLFDALTTESVLSWQRVRIANLMATSGEEWVSLFSRHQSGTYNNQYLVLDLKRFVPKKQLLPGFFWVIEQIPGFIKAEDMTSVLSRGYWPSYNVPYFEEVYNASGYPVFVANTSARGPTFGDPVRWLEYQITPRANIFRRDQGSVSSVSDMQAIMRYNGWASDPFSLNHPFSSVCGRGDLARKYAEPRGCYDTKVTSASMAAGMEALVVGGPTTQGLEPFAWSDRWPNHMHRGMPNRYDFQFERMAADDLQLS